MPGGRTWGLLGSGEGRGPPPPIFGMLVPLGCHTGEPCKLSTWGGHSGVNGEVWGEIELLTLVLGFWMSHRGAL